METSKTRLSRFNQIDEENPKKTTRMGKNQYLYDEINNRIGYEELTSLDTQTRIDLSSISQNGTRENYQKIKDYKELIESPKIKEEKEEKIAEKKEKIYDINSILEEARKNRTEPDELERKRKLKEEIQELNNEKSNLNNDRVKNVIDENELTELINTITSHELSNQIKDAEEKGLFDELITTDIEMQAKDGIVEEVLEKEKNKKIVNSFYTRSMDLSNQDFEISDELEQEKQTRKKIFMVITIIMLIAGIGIAIYFILKKQGIV